MRHVRVSLIILVVLTVGLSLYGCSSGKTPAAVRTLLKDYDLAIVGDAVTFEVTVPQSWEVKLGEYPAGVYWGLANEVSKDIGYDLTSLKGKTVTALRARLAGGLQSREQDTDFRYPTDIIVLLDGKQVAGAWLSWNIGTIGPSLRLRWTEDITGLSYEDWVQRQGYFLDAGENSDLAGMKPEEVMAAFFKAINDGDKKRAYACLAPREQLNMLMVNQQPNCLYNPGPDNNNSMVENITSGEVLSWHYYDPLVPAINVDDTARRTRIGLALEVKMHWRHPAFDTPSGLETRFAIMSNNGFGWKLEGLGTGP